MSKQSSTTAAHGRPRYSALPLPPYSYTPGLAPHPVSDPLGHMFAQEHAAAAPLVPENWRASPVYRFAVDLFNHGFYWEAHEQWEGLWHAAGRHGAVATWLKALIKLAAAGVKAREGNSAGVERHARRAIALVDQLRAELPEDQADYGGVAFEQFDQVAHELQLAGSTDEFAKPEPALLLNFWLVLRDA